MDHQFQIAVTFANLVASFEYSHWNLKQSNKASVKKDLMKTLSFTINQCLKFLNILSIFHVLIIFIIYQTINPFFFGKFNPLPTKFRKAFLYNGENNHVFWSLVKSVGAIKYTNEFYWQKKTKMRWYSLRYSSMGSHFLETITQ